MQKTTKQKSNFPLLISFVKCALFSVFLSNLTYAQNSGVQSTQKLNSAGVERSYVLYIPSHADDSSLPLVLNFHGSGSTPERLESQTDFIRLAEENGFVLVYPVGAFTNSVTSGSWNANLDPGVDDVQFARDMIEDIAGMISLDRKRIYSTGMSGGARITSRLACELSDVLAAAAPVAGLQYPDGCTLQRAIPILASIVPMMRLTNMSLLGIPAHIGEWESRRLWTNGVKRMIAR